MNAFLIDGGKIVKDVQVDDWKIVDQMYVRARESAFGSFQLYHAAFVFPIENKPQVELLLAQIEAAKKQLEAVQTTVYYIELPKLRGVRQAEEEMK